MSAVAAPVPASSMRQSRVLSADTLRKAEMPVKSPAKVADNDVITEAPEGRSQVYAVSSYAWAVVDYSGVFGEFSAAGEVVFTDDAAYIKNPLVGRATDTYLKVDKVDEETYVAKLPYHIYDEDYYGSLFGYDLQICEKTVSPYGDTDYQPTEDRELTYKLVDGQLHLDLGYEPAFDSDGNLLPPDKLLGLFDEYGWCFVGDASQTWMPVEVEAQEAPAGMATEDWQLIANDWGRDIKVGFDGDNVWLTNLSDYMPGAWVKGTIDGDKVVFDSYQYLGISLGQFIYFMAAVDAEVAAGVEIVDSCELAYDPSAKTIKADNPHLYMMLNGSATEVYYLDYWNNPVICVPPADMDLTPRPAMSLEWGDYFDYWGFNVLQFAVTNLSVEDYALDTDNLYYRILCDGEVQTFYAEDSEGALEEDITNIPFNGTCYNYFYDYDTNRQVYVRADGMETVGVQMVYIADDGTEYPSEVAVLTLATDGVEGVSDAEVVRSEYYDLSGRRIVNPASGVCIVKSVHSDGTVTVAKRLFRK